MRRSLAAPTAESPDFQNRSPQRQHPKGAQKLCGQRLYRPVGKSGINAGINPPVDIPPPYPQARHRDPRLKPTVCSLLHPSADSAADQRLKGLSTEKRATINIYIIYLLKKYSLYCYLTLVLQIKLTLWSRFSRISDPLKGLSGSVVNYSGI